MATVHTIDLMHLGLPGCTAAFLIETSEGPILIESGPASSLEHLHQGIQEAGFEPQDIQHVLLTHIHLDHAGAAGWFAQHGAEIYVHPVGAPHLVDPSRLNSSARRIYKDALDEILGEMEACPEDRVHAIADGETVRIGDSVFTALETPGHAIHHHAWDVELNHEHLCFTGDVAGMRIPDCEALTIPFAPPEVDLETWHTSLDRIASLNFDALLLTHSGRTDACSEHLQRMHIQLEEESKMIMRILEDPLSSESDRVSSYRAHVISNAVDAGAPPKLAKRHLSEGHAMMNLMGIERYIKRRSRG